MIEKDGETRVLERCAVPAFDRLVFVKDKAALIKHSSPRDHKLRPALDDELLWTNLVPNHVPNLFPFSQKLKSWVFNDQPCECADVGHSRKIDRAGKTGWEKI